MDGLSLFEKIFSPFRDSFVIIGGAACRAVLADGPVTPRKTVDVDMVLVLERLDRSFISTFWSFIKAGAYKCAKRKDNEGNPKYVLYSFVGGQGDYPSQVELLSRPVDGLGRPEEHHIEVIDIDEDYSHLSAIILDSDYYDYIVAHSTVKNSNALKKVVVTHHLPSHLLVDEQFRGSRLNGAFVSEQSDWIAESDIDYWIYGHSHSNIDDVIGSTICVANQLGYISSNLEPSFGFDAGKVIELKM